MLRLLLEDFPRNSSAREIGADELRLLRTDVSDLDTSAAKDRDGSRISGVLRLGDEIDGFAGRAQGDFEPAPRPSFIRIVRADDR